MAQGKEPNPPALLTATANALPWTPAMGAWMMGSSMPKSSRSFFMSGPAFATTFLADYRRDKTFRQAAVRAHDSVARGSQHNRPELD